MVPKEVRRMGELMDFGVWMQKRHANGKLSQETLLVVGTVIFQYMKANTTCQAICCGQFPLLNRENGLNDLEEV